MEIHWPRLVGSQNLLSAISEDPPGERMASSPLGFWGCVQVRQGTNRPGRGPGPRQSRRPVRPPQAPLTLWQDPEGTTRTNWQLPAITSRAAPGATLQVNGNLGRHSPLRPAQEPQPAKLHSTTFYLPSGALSSSTTTGKLQPEMVLTTIHRKTPSTCWTWSSISLCIPNGRKADVFGAPWIATRPKGPGRVVEIYFRSPPAPAEKRPPPYKSTERHIAMARYRVTAAGAPAGGGPRPRPRAHRMDGARMPANAGRNHAKRAPSSVVRFSVAMLYADRTGAAAAVGVVIHRIRVPTDAIHSM